MVPVVLDLGGLTTTPYRLPNLRKQRHANYPRVKVLGRTQTYFAVDNAFRNACRIAGAILAFASLMTMSPNGNRF